MQTVLDLSARVNPHEALSPYSTDNSRAQSSVQNRPATSIQYTEKSSHSSSSASAEYLQDVKNPWGRWIENRLYYSLEIAQQPLRARMCGFGDKDRRPIHHAVVAKLKVDRRGEDGSLSSVHPNDVDTTFFIVTADLFAEDGVTDRNLVSNPSAGIERVSAAQHSSAIRPRPRKRKRGQSPPPPLFGPPPAGAPAPIAPNPFVGNYDPTASPPASPLPGYAPAPAVTRPTTANLSSALASTSNPFVGVYNPTASPPASPLPGYAPAPSLSGGTAFPYSSFLAQPEDFETSNCVSSNPFVGTYDPTLSPPASPLPGYALAPLSRPFMSMSSNHNIVPPLPSHGGARWPPASYDLPLNILSFPPTHSSSSLANWNAQVSPSFDEGPPRKRSKDQALPPPPSHPEWPMTTVPISPVSPTSSSFMNVPIPFHPQTSYSLHTTATMNAAYGAADVSYSPYPQHLHDTTLSQLITPPSSGSISTMSVPSYSSPISLTPLRPALPPPLTAGSIYNNSNPVPSSVPYTQLHPPPHIPPPPSALSTVPSIPRVPAPRTFATRPQSVRALVGPTSASAQKLNDDKKEPGIFFVFSDLSVRIEGTFRIRLRLLNIGVPPAPGGLSPSSHSSQSFVLASVCTEPFIVHSAKRFPGVPDSSSLSLAFADQGVKLPLRAKEPSEKQNSKRRRSNSKDEIEHMDDG